VNDEHLHTESTPDQNHLLDHAYDGIQEYDNPLPRWWLALFWITIIFTPLYILYFHFGGGMLATERYDAEMVAFFDKQAEQLLALGEINETMLAGLTSDPSMMNSGEKIFRSKCATCHGMFGEGGIGPNLTDDYWIHGGQFLDVYATVRDGVTAKGMLAWERQLRPAELMAVSAYAGTLLGTDPPNAKAPQGEQVARLAPEEVDGTESADEAVDEPTADEVATEPASS
jgi:cytochrome c oxidase cbb3-type subunit 3